MNRMWHIFEGERWEWFKAVKFGVMPISFSSYLSYYTHTHTHTHTLAGKNKNTKIFDNKKNGFCLHWVLTGQIYIEGTEVKRQRMIIWALERLVEFLHRVCRGELPSETTISGKKGSSWQWDSSWIGVFLLSPCWPAPQTSPHLSVFSPRQNEGIECRDH